MNTRPIFMEEWWMDAVCAGKAWQYILPEMPCLMRKRWWMRWITMPQQTQIGGMWVDTNTCTVTQAHDLATQIDAKLRELKLAYYYQQYPVGSPLPMEMKALGYKAKERITYRIDDLSDLDKVIGNFSKNKKRQLQKALSLHAERDMSIEDFYRFHTLCMASKGRKISYSREFLLVLNRKAQRADRAQVLSICNADGEVYAAAYLVWDDEYMYYLIPCFSKEHRDSGAGALLVLEAIKLAREKGLKFDFEGSMRRGIANHYRQFGATPTVYYSVEKLFRWPFAIALAINWLKNLRF
ncbi:MAG: GNAT family N-acetyltransferase [Paludibacteraceae bacterium]|nr:GNAT family N-acetyltransferase [Paludibacteraceae bacterium]